jgi:hypothetical protein
MLSSVYLQKQFYLSSSTTKLKCGIYVQCIMNSIKSTIDVSERYASSSTLSW